MRSDAASDAADGSGEAPVKKKVVYGKKKPAPKRTDAQQQAAAEEAAVREAADAAAAEEACERMELEQQRLAEEQAVSCCWSLPACPIYPVTGSSACLAAGQACCSWPAAGSIAGHSSTVCQCICMRGRKTLCVIA